nr:unknown [Zea mays]
MVFYDAPSDYNLVDGKDDFVYLNDILNEPLGNESLFDGDDMMAYFDATENDFKYDILGSGQGLDYPLADMPLNFAQKSDKEDKFTFEGISEVPEANPQYGASSSGSHEDLYTDTEFLGVPTDDTADKTYGNRLASMLGSIPAPPAMASEFPPSTGKSAGMLSAVSSSSIRFTAGIIQLDGLTFSSGSGQWPLQKNGDLSLLVSFAVEGDVASKLPVGLGRATRISTVPMVLRSGFYLFFMSAMILLFSYKVGSCIYSR